MRKYHVILLVLLQACLQQANAQLKIGDQPTNREKSVALDVRGTDGKQGLWLPRVTDTSITGVRAYNPPNGLLIYHTPSGKLMVRSTNQWITYLNEAITRISAGGQSLTGPTISLLTGKLAGASNDINIESNSSSNTVTINIPDATTTVRGVVSTGVQSFAGTKTFANGITVNNGATLNNGTTANNGLTVTGATGSTSNLNLGITSATTAAGTTDKYLSVNASGAVTLNATNVITSSTIRIKTYNQNLDGLPDNLNNTDVKRFTITIPGANFSTSSTVIVTPTTQMKLGTRIDYARVKDATTIEMNISTNGQAQPLTNGTSGNFNITVIEF
jgi:hypothetical protein